MKYLLITDNSDLLPKIESVLIKKDKKNKVLTSDFSNENLKKIKKNLADVSAVFIFANSDSPENLSALIQISGFCAAYKINLYTNLNSLVDDSIFAKDGLNLIEADKIESFIDKKYQKIYDQSKARLAKKKLLDRGIPFTSDCFATYIAKNKIEVFNEFLEAGMSVNSRDDMGVPMLNIACRNDNFEFVEMLLDLGAELDASSDDRGYTAVMDAVWRGNEKITKFLIEKGADLNTISKEGQSNLVLAVGADRLNIVKLLAENGSDPDVKDMMGMSAYNYATLFRKEKIVEILKPYHKDM